MSNIAPKADVSQWFQQKVVENYRLFYTIAFQILRKEHEAEDAVQEATLKAWRQLGELQEPTALVGWVARITRNAALDRKKRRTPDSTEDSVLDQVDARGVETSKLAVDHADDRTAILRELEQVPEQQAIVITLRFFEGLDIDQIAATLGLTENNVRVRLHRGIENLRRSPRFRSLFGDSS